MLFDLTPYYTVQPKVNGRWAVVHRLPGLQTIYAEDADCLTEGAAIRECAWLTAERAREHARLQEEQQLLGARA